MPMPELDPSRYVTAVLADPSHTLPMPDRGGRPFIKEGEVVDLHDPFYASLFADGSLVLKPADSEVPEVDKAEDEGSESKDATTKPKAEPARAEPPLPALKPAPAQSAPAQH